MSTKAKFWLAVALQLLVLFGMIGMHSYTIATGRPVLLKTAPVDPWDMFRGEYVMLSYEISRLEPSTVTMTGLPYHSDQTVWVTLTPGNPYWTATAVSDERPAVTGDQTVIRGKVVYYWDSYTPPSDSPEPFRPAELRVRYGIEQFYVPEGEGRDLQQQVANMSVEALVDSFGRAALHKVFVGDKEIRWQ